MIIVGIGNPYRGDDGAGWAVIEALEKTLDQKYLRKSSGDVGELLEIFSSFSSIYLIDACLADASFGAWQRIDALQEIFIKEKATSTHGFSLSQTIHLAKTLQQLPKKLIIYAIAGSKYQMSRGLSSRVQKAILEVAQEIIKEKHEIIF